MRSEAGVGAKNELGKRDILRFEIEGVSRSRLVACWSGVLSALYDRMKLIDLCLMRSRGGGLS